MGADSMEKNTFTSPASAPIRSPTVVANHSHTFHHLQSTLSAFSFLFSNTSILRPISAIRLAIVHPIIPALANIAYIVIVQNVVFTCMPMFVSIAAHSFYVFTRSDFAVISVTFVFVCIAEKGTGNGEQGTGSVEKSSIFASYRLCS